VTSGPHPDRAEFWTQSIAVIHRWGDQHPAEVAATDRAVSCCGEPGQIPATTPGESSCGGRAPPTNKVIDASTFSTVDWKLVANGQPVTITG
jgi:hypothetical protein